MSPASFPKMFLSEQEGWSEIVRLHPSVRKLFRSLVIPMSLIPPLMYAYAELVHPGEIFPLRRPAYTGGDLIINGLVFFAIELAMVSFMATVIRQIADSAEVKTSYEDAYTLAAIAPIPLWLAPLALFIPSVAVNLVVLTLAWVGSAALIRHGVRPLLHVEDEHKAHHMADLITASGVMAWIGLVVVASLLLSFLLVWWR